ncbi:MAG: RlmE family RNA methyltransferase, partial [bacterium]
MLLIRPVLVLPVPFLPFAGSSLRTAPSSPFPAHEKVQDHFFNKAKREGFAARSVYKLEEIDRKRKLLRPGMRALDLGCAPGSWLQYAAGRVGPSGRVVGVDLHAVTAKLPPQARVLTGDVFSLSPQELMAEGEEALFDVILSDMAPKTTGIKQADAARSATLVRRVLSLALEALKPGGACLAKVFQGVEMKALRG